MCPLPGSPKEPLWRELPISIPFGGSNVVVYKKKTMVTRSDCMWFHHCVPKCQQTLQNRKTQSPKQWLQVPQVLAKISQEMEYNQSLPHDLQDSYWLTLSLPICMHALIYTNLICINFQSVYFLWIAQCNHELKIYVQVQEMLHVLSLSIRTIHQQVLSTQHYRTWISWSLKHSL
jgi:hypothetical protein